MSHLPKVLNALSRLLSYPDEQTVQTAELLYVVLQAELPEAAKQASAFGGFLEQHDLTEAEEAFTQTFDVNPACALEVGWHLFGEEYARGMFLVRMREEMRKYGLPESVELPDHVAHVLAIVAAMPDDEANHFVRACVLPATVKLHLAVKEKDTPYGSVVGCLLSVLKHLVGEESAAAIEDAVQAPSHQSGPFESDPLRAFPVADVGCGCESSCNGPAEVTQINMNHSVADEHVSSASPTQTKRQ